MDKASDTKKLSVTEKAYAKVNLTLDVTGVLPDGYHEVSMVMQSIPLFDEITISRRDDNETVLNIVDGGVLKGAALSAGSKNLACRAAAEFFAHPAVRERLNAGNTSANAAETQKTGVNIELIKNIPLEAGMAGGSSDAAAVLRGLNRLFECGLSEKTLCEIGVKIGADVPFCILGGTTCLAEGIGEKLSVLPPAPHLRLLLVKPPVGASTKDIYNGLVLDENTVHPDNAAMIAAIEAQDIYGICKNLSNVLEPVTVGLLPVIGVIKEKMLELGADGALMSGSGSTVFGIFTDKEKATAARDYFAKDESLFTALLD